MNDLPKITEAADLQPATSRYYRLTSLMRLPAGKGQGVYNEATLFHERESLRVGWTSATVDSRLRRGDIVTVREGRHKGPRPEVLPAIRLVRVDQPVAAVNPFELVPVSWVNDATIARRAVPLWARLERPLQHLLNAVLWDGARFYRYITGPATAADDPAASAGNFRRAVALAEEALSLADGLPNVAHGVLIAAALLHGTGQADDFHRAADGRGLKPSERRHWIGDPPIVLEWLALARTQVIVPAALYHHLIHVLIALCRPTEPPRAIETSILKAARRLVDAPERSRPLDRLISCATLDLH